MKVIDRISKKMISAILIGTMVGVCMVGCGKEESQVENQEIVAKEGSVLVEDCYGKQIEVKENPEYIGSVFASISHALGMLGETSRIVAISEGNTRDYLFCEMFPEILEARVAKGNSAISIEETMKDPAPDVLIMNPEGAMDEAAETQFSNMGVPTLTVSFNSLQEQLDIMSMLGDLVQQEERAKKYIDYTNDIVELVESRVGNLKEEEKVSVYHSINELLRTDKPDSLSSDWMELAGTHNVAFDIIDADAEFTLTSKSYVALEELLQADPECIIINGGDVYDYIMANERFHNMQAFKNDKIFIIPLGATRWGHPNSMETCMAVLWTASTIYPEYFEDIDMREETKRFYSEVWNYELSDEQVDNILGGRVYKEIKGDGVSGV